MTISPGSWHSIPRSAFSCLMPLWLQQAGIFTTLTAPGLVLVRHSGIDCICPDLVWTMCIRPVCKLRQDMGTHQLTAAMLDPEAWPACVS